ncbi:MAG: SAM-dependent methyltransferase, partial [Verrucomicrobiota bacterium]
MNDLESNPLAFVAAGPGEAADAAGAKPVAGEAQVPVPGWSDRVCRALVDRALAPMMRGRLDLRLPGGGIRRYGSGPGGPAAELVVRRERFFRRCVLGGDIGFGEAYQEGDWDTPDLAAVVGWFCANVEQAPTLSGSRRGPVWYANLGWWVNRLRHRWNRNSESGSRRNIHAHYDLGNEFYALWLDATMTYSAALFRRPDQPLAEAQSAKYERLCRQLRLTAGDHVLEIGSGWGGFAEHAVRHHGCRVTSVTISPAQQRYAAARLARAGMADRAEVRLEDYRRLTGQFDKVVSIEMLE